MVLMHRTPAWTAVLLALLLICGRALAQDGTAAAEPGVPAESASSQPLWEAGLFAAGGSQQAYPGSKQQVNRALVLPFFVYRGRVVRAEQGGVGLRAAHTESVDLDIGFAGSFGSAASDNDARRGLPDIGWLVEFGPRLRWRLGAAWGGNVSAALPVRGVFDVSNGFDYRGIAVEPVLTWGARAHGWGYGTSLGLLAGDRRLADTFYGVAPAYATVTRPAYEAKAGLIATRLAFNVSRRLAPDWRFFAYARVDSVHGAANEASPLVDRKTGASVGIGLAWTGLRSAEPGQP
jgi:outer membrane protein